MCLFWQDHHTQCQHTETSTNNRCPRAIQTGSDCAQTDWLTEHRLVPLPLCVNCYRETERQICDESDEQLKMIDEYHTSVREFRDNTVLSPQEQTELYELLDQARYLYNEVREERARKLEEFRTSQGVWGDG